MGDPFKKAVRKSSFRRLRPVDYCRLGNRKTTEGASDFAAATKNSTIIAVAVKPNSSRNEIVSYNNEKKAWIISIKAPADKDKANKELLKFLRKETGRAWMIKSGSRSHEKTLAAISS